MIAKIDMMYTQVILLVFLIQLRYMYSLHHLISTSDGIHNAVNVLNCDTLDPVEDIVPALSSISFMLHFAPPCDTVPQPRGEPASNTSI